MWIDGLGINKEAKFIRDVEMNAKSIIQRVSICVALIFIVLTSGCAIGPTIRTYSGDKLQRSEVSVIKGWWAFFLFGYGGFELLHFSGA